MSTITPRKKRHARSRQAILDAAASMIMQHGYEKLSLRELARQADYSPAGLYEYFASKEDILLAISEQITRQMSAALEAVPQDMPVRDHLVQLALAYIQYALQNKEHFQLMNALPSRRKSLDEPVPPDSPYTILLRAVQRALDAGEIQTRADTRPDEIAFSLWALVHGIAALRLTHLQDFQADFEKTDRQAIETLLKGLA